MLTPRPNTFLLLLIFVFSTTAPAQDDTTVGDDVVMMEAFNVSAYGGKIPIVDGFTGKDYRGNNQVVFDFATTFNKLLLGFHRKLVLDEIKHMKFRFELGDQFEAEMNKLIGPFGFDQFALDRTDWLSRERAIVSRLIKEPFFTIKSLVAWDLDRLREIAPEKPKSKYADDINYNLETQSWERRLTARWTVFYHRNGNKYPFHTQKDQGLNLDTLRGFHYIEQGLPSEVPPHAFKEVKLTYPIFYSDENITEEELTRLQETFIANLYFIYDPFSWVARRDTRFRGGFRQDCLDHVKDERLYVDDRKWFDNVFSRYLSDVVTIKLQGAEEIYSLHMTSKRFGESPQILGVGMDTLNWNKGEGRAFVENPETIVRLGNYHNTWGTRFLLIDAYQRHGDVIIDRIRTRLLSAQKSRKKINAKAMIREIIEDLSGLSYDQFGKRAMRTQEAELEKFSITRQP